MVAVSLLSMAALAAAGKEPIEVWSWEPVEERVGGRLRCGKGSPWSASFSPEKCRHSASWQTILPGQTEVAGIADHVARAIFLHNSGGVFFAFGAGFVVGQVLDPGLF